MACQDMIIFSMKTKLTEKAVPKRDESTKRTMPKRLLSEFEKKKDSCTCSLFRLIQCETCSNKSLILFCTRISLWHFFFNRHGFARNRSVARLWLAKQEPSIERMINMLHNMKIQTNLRIGCTCTQLRPYMCCTQRFKLSRTSDSEESFSGEDQKSWRTSKRKSSW